MKGPHTNGAATMVTAEEREQAKLVAGYVYFENGKAKFPEAYNELLLSVGVTAYTSPEAFTAFLHNAGRHDEVQPQQWLNLADALESLAIQLRIRWKEAASQG